MLKADSDIQNRKKITRRSESARREMEGRRHFGYWLLAQKYALKETRKSWTHSDALKVCWHLPLNAIIHLLVTIQSYKIQLGSNDWNCPSVMTGRLAEQLYTAINTAYTCGCPLHPIIAIRDHTAVWNEFRGYYHRMAAVHFYCVK